MKFSILKVFVFLILGCSSVFADSIPVGGPGDSFTGDCAPFGCALRYQQIYGSNLFGGPISITGLTFFNKNFVPGSIAFANYVISFSTTTVPLNGLSTTFADNLGADNQLFFAGPLGGPIDSSGEFTISGIPFSYNPAQGHLLMTISKDGDGLDFSVFLDFSSGAPSGTFSRAFAFNDSGIAETVENDAGLVTTFGFVPVGVPTVPEPVSLVLLFFGIAGVALKANVQRT